MLGIRHLAGPIRDVGSADRRESVAGARCRCGFGDTSLIVLVKDPSATRDSFDEGLGGFVDQRWRRERTMPPNEGIPKGGTHLLALGVSPGQLDCFVALVLQQHGEQSALRKGGD